MFDLYAVYMLLPLGIRFFSHLFRCLGLRWTIRENGDFEGRALTDTDLLCIGPMPGSIDAQRERMVRVVTTTKQTKKTVGSFNSNNASNAYVAHVSVLWADDMQTLNASPSTFQSHWATSD